MTYQPPFKRTDRIDSLCMEIAELVGMLGPEAALAKSPQLHRELQIKSIHSSLLIEGNQLDEKAVTAIIDGKRVLGDSHDILEVKNAKRAYDMLPNLDPFSLKDLLQTHGIMMDGLVLEAGRFRTGNVGVFDGDKLIHAGTPSAYVPEVMSDLFSWLASTTTHPLLASCIFHYEFEFCHPFSDGNGRVGRLWHTLLLSKWKPALAWLPVESSIKQHQSGYYEALAQSNATGSSEFFVEFMLEAIRDSLLPFANPAGEHNWIKAKRNSTKTAVLEYFRNNTDATIDQLTIHLDCSKRTAERLVAELKDEGTLARDGSARAGTWIVSDYKEHSDKKTHPSPNNANAQPNEESIQSIREAEEILANGGGEFESAHAMLDAILKE